MCPQIDLMKIHTNKLEKSLPFPIHQMSGDIIVTSYNVFNLLFWLKIQRPAQNGLHGIFLLELGFQTN
jgi:hypothetical protein